MTLKALLHDAIFLATCNAIPLLIDVKLANTYEPLSDFPIEFFTNETAFTNLHLLRAELHCKLQEKLHRVTGPLKVAS